MRLVPGPTKRSDAIPADVSDARVARLWAGVSARLDAPRRWPWFAAAGAAAAAVLVIALLRPGATAETPVAAVHASVAAGEQARRVVLGDGSELALEPRTHVFVAKQEPSALELDLNDGIVTCEVAHVAGRRFVVRAGPVRVIAVGTRFSVSRRGGPS